MKATLAIKALTNLNQILKIFTKEERNSDIKLNLHIHIFHGTNYPGYCFQETTARQSATTGKNN